MFEKFLQTPECMKLLSWMLNHSEGEYSAAIVGLECDMLDMSRYMAAISILENTGFLKIVESSEEVFLRLDTEASITKLLIHLKEEFNDVAFRNDQVSPSLGYLHSDTLKKLVDMEMFNEVDATELINLCKNYKDLDLSDKTNKEIYDLCEKLEASGEYENFIRRLENHS